MTLHKKYSKSVSVVFNELNYFSNELWMKWYKLFKKRCRFQTLFFVAVFCVITYCCVLHVTFHREKQLMSILCFVMFLLPVVIYFHISDKLVIALWPRTIWQIFSSFLIFCFYFTRLKAREISWKIRETRKIFTIL